MTRRKKAPKAAGPQKQRPNSGSRNNRPDDTTKGSRNESATDAWPPLDQDGGPEGNEVFECCRQVGDTGWPVPNEHSGWGDQQPTTGLSKWPEAATTLPVVNNEQWLYNSSPMISAPGIDDLSPPQNDELQGDVLPQHKTKPISNPVLIPEPNQVWVPKRTLAIVKGSARVNAMTKVTPPRSTAPVRTCCKFHGMAQFAQWVLDIAKYRPIHLDFSSSPCCDDARDAVLYQFHRWPESKIIRAAEKCQRLGHDVEEQSQEQVELYVRELRANVEPAANALFWLHWLVPESETTSMAVPDGRAALETFLAQLKSADGVYGLLSERVRALLTLPLKIEPLLCGVCSLALDGHETSTREGMRMLILYAEEYTMVSGRKRNKYPLGLSVLSSVGMMKPPCLTDLAGLPPRVRSDIARPLALMKRDWVVAVDKALGKLAASLLAQWVSCGQAPHEREFQDSVSNCLQDVFARLCEALVKHQLYAIQEYEQDSETPQDPVRVSGLRKRGRWIECEANL